MCNFSVLLLDDPDLTDVDVLTRRRVLSLCAHLKWFFNIKEKIRSMFMLLVKD